jgi:hypothetical protein
MPEHAARQFPLSFNRLMRVLMTPMLAGRRYCHVTVSADHFDVRMGVGGWAFAAKIPRTAIVESAEVSGPVWGWGAHGWRGRWLVNGSSRGLVSLRVDPRARGRCLGVPVRVRELTVSLDDPALFLATLAEG